ncbi:hypothetical protein P261_00904 [Lachnospiraceae bacterium TWA4]|nr:hypothetical protein P261_00904 [Lachnospiraceae bacterium TWA4]
MKKIFCIGDFCFELLLDDRIQIPVMFQKFEVLDKSPKYFYDIEVVDELPDFSESIVTKREDIVIGKSQVGESRLLGVKGTLGYYAYYLEHTKDSSKIWLDKSRLEGLSIDPVFTSLMALERRMMDRNQFVLHCAYMVYKGEAILFSAPSETGKTTQANLWEKYKGSRTVNGDRALLSFDGNQLYANGWPVCGTSEVCENEKFPVKAIVMLSQEKENSIEVMKVRDAFMSLYSQITINGWNNEFINRGMDFIEKILQTVPVYHLGCTISKEAVEVLHSALENCYEK